MENIKLGDLYLPRKVSRNIFELLAKMRNINDYKSKSNDYMKYLKSNLKIKKE